MAAGACRSSSSSSSEAGALPELDNQDRCGASVGLVVPLLARHADGERLRCAVTIALYAGIRVCGVTAARAWYERLLGEPLFFAKATEVVWTLADDRSIYLLEDFRRAGGALITVACGARSRSGSPGRTDRAGD